MKLSAASRFDSSLRLLGSCLPLLLAALACSEGEEKTAQSQAKLTGMLDVLEEKAFHITEELPEEWLEAAGALLREGVASQRQGLLLANSERPDASGVDLPRVSQGAAADVLAPGHGTAPSPGIPVFDPPPLDPVPSLEDWPFVPGEVVVRLEGASPETVASLHEQAGLQDYRFEISAYGSAEIVSLRIRAAAAPERPIDEEETREVAARLAKHPRLGYAHLNYFRRTFAVPDDEHYPLQWHLRQLNMEFAWEMSTGSSQVVVAVLDSGVKRHSDLDERLLPGYDMVSSARLAGDGDGRDRDPSPVRGRAWHGQHVAGTIGATTNNGTGIAGVDWACRILPVRVMGLTGWGTSIDVIAGIHWAVGENVPGVPRNPHPAHVLNLSLGGGSLVKAEQEAVDAAVRAGALVVVAAGNDNQDASRISFAGYRNVLTVGASDINGYRAPYSNFGPAVDLLAPGGNVSQDMNGDGYPDGVLSLFFDWRGQHSAYTFLQGTSMAAPHVAGVAALLKAVDPKLTPADLKRILRDSAHTQGVCPEGCGKGLLNPVKALSMAGGDRSSGPKLAVSADRLDLGRSRRGQLLVSNGGGAPLEWRASVEGAHASLFILGKSSGTVEPAGSETLEVQAKRDGLKDGSYEATLVVEGAGTERKIGLSFTVRQKLPDVGTVWVGLVSWTEEGKARIAAAVPSDHESGYTWKLSPAPGSWILMAVADRDGDGALGRGDLVGFWRNWEDRQPIDLEAGAQLSELDFPLRPYMIRAPYRADGTVGSACDRVNPCQGPYACQEKLVDKGICTRSCGEDGYCPGGHCVLLTRDVALCLPLCDEDKACARDGFTCEPLRSGAHACVPPF